MAARRRARDILNRVPALPVGRTLEESARFLPRVATQRLPRRFHFAGLSRARKPASVSWRGLSCGTTGNTRGASADGGASRVPPCEPGAHQFGSVTVPTALFLFVITALLAALNPSAPPMAPPTQRGLP